jgi:hypothetical protein
LLLAIGLVISQGMGTVQGVATCPAEALAKEEATHPPRQLLLFTNIPRSAFRNPHFPPSFLAIHV